MAAPTLTNVTIAGVYGDPEVRIDDPVSLKLDVSQAGDDSTSIRIIVDWSDSSPLERYQIAPGRSLRLTHGFTSPGVYQVKVSAVNASESSQYTASIEILPLAERQKTIHRWSGPTIGGSSIDYGYETVRSYTPEVFSIVSQALQGSSIIKIANPYFQVGDEVIVNSPGKLLSFGTVINIGDEGKTAYLNFPLADNYDPGAGVEVRRKERTRESQPVQLDGTIKLGLDISLVKDSILNLLTTRPGERVMFPTIGGRHHELPFEPMDGVTETLLKTYTAEVLELEPRAATAQMKIERQDDDGQLSMSILLTFADSVQSVLEVSIPTS